jgi:hypothetical protein
MRDASGLFLVSFMVKAFWGDQRWNRWGRGHKGAKVLFTFLPFYLLKAAAACYTEGGSDGCKEGDCNLQNCFPGTCFHNVYFLMLNV